MWKNMQIFYLKSPIVNHLYEYRQAPLAGIYGTRKVMFPGDIGRWKTGTKDGLAVSDIDNARRFARACSKALELP